MVIEPLENDKLYQEIISYYKKIRINLKKLLENISINQVMTIMVIISFLKMVK